MHSTLALLRRPPADPFVKALTCAALAGSLACGGGPPAGPGGPGGPGQQAMPVEVQTLAPKPVEQVGNFVATVKSRRAAVIQPQVEGFVTKIAVASGDRVRAGETLLEIDAASQQAAVAALRSTHTARAAEATWARQQEDRAQRLLDLGAASQQDYDQAVATRKSAEAQLQAAEDQVRQQTHELGFYRVTAPTAGIVGDVPVRVGDRVTQSTLLTTIDDNSGLEVYVSVPVDRGPDLTLGLPVRVLSETGAVLATEQVSFIAPTVDDATQTILVKAALGGGPGSFRAGQLVRAQILWSTAPALTVPVIAATRINGRYFVFLATDGPEGTVAKQQAIQVGAIVGNDYVVLDGLQAGDRLIVSGLQKLGDGSKINPTAAAAPEEAS